MRKSLRFALLLPCLLATPAAIAETKVSIGAVTVDQLAVRDLSCALDHGGMMEVMSVVGNLAKQRSALDACAPDGAAFRVQWKWTGAGATPVKVLKGSAPGENQCIERALTNTRSANTGECTATVLVGNAAKAAKAADALGK